MAGKYLMDEEWISLVDQEDGEAIVMSLIDEIISNTQKIVFERNIEKQIVPFSSKFGKNVAIDLIKVSCP